MTNEPLQNTQIGIDSLHITIGASLVAQMAESACSAEDLSSIPGSGRSPGEGNGNPLQYPCLENSMEEGIWQASESDTTEVT